MKKIRKNSGAVLILAILATVVLFITGGAILALGFQSRIYQIRTACDVAARSAADAGTTKALVEMNQLFTSGNLGSNLPSEKNISLPGSDSSYSYTVTKDAGIYTITAVGQSKDTQRTVEATLVATNPFDFGIFSKDDLTLRNSAEIDMYNNDSFDDPLKVGTNSINNGAIDLQNSIKIYGDIAVGVGGNPDQVIDIGNSIEIEGDTYSQTTNNILPSVTVPAYLQSAASGGTINNNKTITTSGKYDEIDLGNSKEIKVSGPVELYITGDINLGNSTKIELDDSNPNSSLTIYLNGELVANNSSELNNKTEVPKNFKLYGTDNCKSLDFNNSAKMFGVIYAPEADIVFHNSIELYGSMVGNNIDFIDSVKMWYDASLRDSVGNDGLSGLKMNRWKEL